MGQCHFGVKMTCMNLGFLASHRGSNMQAVIDACTAGRLPATPAVIISNNSQSGALARAIQEHIPHYHLSAKTHPLPEQLDRAIYQALQQHGVDLVILAGYMRQIGPETLAAFHGRIINIHPALLPKFGGKGMYGLNVHRAVLAAGEQETGVTIHLVDADYDTGPILAQCQVPVVAGDTAESLATRVLEQEHRFLVETIGHIISGEIVLP
jgi:phosphoribosylglycinamide formyltransferase-1